MSIYGHTYHRNPVSQDGSSLKYCRNSSDDMSGRGTRVWASLQRHSSPGPLIPPIKTAVQACSRRFSSSYNCLQEMNPKFCWLKKFLGLQLSSERSFRNGGFKWFGASLPSAYISAFRSRSEEGSHWSRPFPCNPRAWLRVFLWERTAT